VDIVFDCWLSRAYVYNSLRIVKVARFNRGDA